MKRNSVSPALAAACFALVVCGACGSDSAPSSPPFTTAGTGTATAGTGTAPTAGTGVITAGGGAVTATSGTGATAGSGPVATAGTGAATAGTGAATAGTGAAATGGMTCATADKSAAPAALHAAAMAAIVPAAGASAPCAFSSCHVANVKKAKLIIDSTTTNLKTTLVDIPSCEASNFKLVDGGGGDTALAKSWLWLKLTAPVDASENLVPDATWGTSMSCGQATGTGYGQRMPYGAGSLLAADKLTALLNWICAGAPGPT